MTVDPGGYCADLARRQDRERYLCALFAPSDVRADLLALLAFNLELAQTAERVSEARLGAIRLQWWREALDGIEAGHPRAHAVVRALAAVRWDWTTARPLLDAMIDAREQDLALPPPTRGAFRAYLAGAAGSLGRLWALRLMAADPGRDSPPERAFALYGLVGHLRAVPFHARANRVFLPGDMLAGEGVRLDQVGNRETPSGLAAVIGGLAEDAEQTLATLRSDSPFASAMMPVLLPAWAAARHLERFKRAGCDPFAAPADPLLVARLAWAVLRRQI